jgi:NTP pyrophosphatase (non-canonical NTP hydrolase)
MIDIVNCFSIIVNMTFDEYESLASKTALYPNRGGNINYAALGLVGEAGEIANAVKKVGRDDEGVVTDERKMQLKAELGDVLWYCAALAHEAGFTLTEAAEYNIEKLKSRMERGVLGGSGDNR